MESVILIKGKVTYTITIDPGVWIFDERKVDLTTYFHQKQDAVSDLDEYTKSMSKHWDREISEGAAVPQLKPEAKFQKEILVNGTFGIPFRPFLANAEPLADAKFVVIDCGNDQVKLPLNDAYQLILGFSKDGKPLIEDGPIHAYYHDGSNLENPFKRVSGFTVI